MVAPSPEGKMLLNRYNEQKAQHGEQWREEAKLRAPSFTPDLNHIHDVFAKSASRLSQRGRQGQQDVIDCSRKTEMPESSDTDSDSSASSSMKCVLSGDVVDTAGATCGRLYALHEASVERQRSRRAALEQELQLSEQAESDRRKDPDSIVPNERQLRLYNLSPARQVRDKKPEGKDGGQSGGPVDASPQITTTPVSESPSRRGSGQSPLVGVLVTSTEGAGLCSPHLSSNGSSHPFARSPISRLASSGKDSDASGGSRRSTSIVRESRYGSSKSRQPSVSAETQLWYDTRKAELVHRRRERQKSIVELIHSAGDSQGGHLENEDAVKSLEFPLEDVDPRRHSRQFIGSPVDKPLSATMSKKVSFAAASVPEQGELQQGSDLFGAVGVSSRSSSSIDST
jgi:hypothetical protein